MPVLKTEDRRTRALHPLISVQPRPNMSQASIAALPPPLRPTDDDWAKMLAAHVHLGTKNLDNNMVCALDDDTLPTLPPTPEMASTWGALLLGARASWRQCRSSLTT